MPWGCRPRLVDAGWSTRFGLIRFLTFVGLGVASWPKSQKSRSRNPLRSFLHTECRNLSTPSLALSPHVSPYYLRVDSNILPALEQILAPSLLSHAHARSAESRSYARHPHRASSPPGPMNFLLPPGPLSSWLRLCLTLPPLQPHTLFSCGLRAPGSAARPRAPGAELWLGQLRLPMAFVPLFLWRLGLDCPAYLAAQY